MSKNVVNMLIDQKLFDHYCQPIFDLKNNKKVGGELLLRTELGTPEDIFQQAKKINKLYELDTTSITSAINAAPLFQERLLFLNVFPSTIKNPFFIPLLEGFIQKKQIKPNQIVFEINETEKIKNIELLKEKICSIQKLGFLVACDDIGKGSMDLTYMLELNVNYIKLDQGFSKNLNKCVKKQDLIRAVLYFCQLNKIKVILEGIENAETFISAKKLGVDMGQGYHLGMPRKMTMNMENLI